ncbi:MAG: type II secretion system protein, partial [Rubrivivax sp.]|nr:type II secretion system protein [Rubrivivax sp.]
MKSRQTGFTLIELVMVIVLNGVLAAVAVPKFVDLGSDARAAAAQGVAGGLSSAASINYAARKARSTNGVAVTNCQHVGPLLQGGLPSGYAITDTTVAADASVDCTVTGPSSATATF